MATQVQLRRGTTAAHSTFTGALGEVTVDTDKDTLVVHDGGTAGGFPLLAKTQTDGTADGVLYLNGSKVTTSGAGLQFNGTTLTATAFSGPLNGTVGATTPASGAFTTLTASSTATLNTLASSGATLTGGTINGMAIGGSTAAAGAFTTLAASGAVTLSGGTANGVLYLNGSKIATSGSDFVFDGTNLGLGVTPSAWGSGIKSLDVNGSSFASSTATLDIANNAFYNGSGWIYKNTATAAKYTQSGGVHYWYNAPSGTAGNAITFTQAMTLDASGNLGIGTTSITSYGATYKNFDVSGSNGAYITLKGTSTPITADFAADSTVVYLGSKTAHPLVFRTSDTERARIDSSGNFQLGAVNDGVTKSFAVYQGGGGEGTIYGIFTRTNGGSDSLRIQNANDYYANAAACAVALGRNSVNSRSINAGGTVNASGADYAEYMTKADDFVIAKGDVVGINDQGKLTNVFANAVSFMVKSTDPSYVGGDSWGADFEDDAEGLENARQKVDRIAFSGQVPVNVYGATAGQYIVPVQDGDGIKGIAVSNPTFEQYQNAVGKVIAVETDGRAKIIVKVA